MAATFEVRAPGRVNLVGEHTDYNDGLCLPVAIPAQTVARVRVLDDGPSRLTSAQRDGPWTGTPAEAAPGRVTGWASYAAGVLWVLDQAGWDLPPLDIRIDGDVPLGSGLSSSASLTAAVAVAATCATGRVLDGAVRGELVDVCRRAETEVAGAPTGGLDQSAVLLARSGHAMLLDFGRGGRAPAVEHVPLDPASAGLALLVVDTRVAHTNADGGYGTRRAECEEAARRLGVASLRHVTADGPPGLADEVLRRRARHVVTENDRVNRVVGAVAAHDWQRVGALFTESHVSLRDDFEVSCDELDLAVATVLAAGALGARMTGGGFGGSAVALVPVELVDHVRRAVDTAFARAGLAAPRHLDATPSAGAGVLTPSR